MAYRAIPPVDGACASDPWGDNAATLAAGLVPTLTNVCFRSSFAHGFSVSGAQGGSEIERAAVSGVGANATIDITANGGVLLLDTGTTGNSFRIVRNVNGTAAAGLRADLVANARTAKYAVGIRVKVGTVGAGCTMNLVCIGDEATADGAAILAVKGATSLTNWVWLIGAAAAVDTGVALPTAAYASVMMVANGTTITAWNLDTGAQIGTGQAQSAVGAVAVHPFMNALNTAAASNTAQVDDWICITEPAA